MAAVSIFVDQREPTWAQALKFGGIPKIVTMLEAGDYQIATDDGALLAVERKTATDFLNTLRDDRLYPQVSKLRQLTPWAYIAVCGSLIPSSAGKCFANGVETGWDWAAVDGAFLTIQELGVNIMHVASDIDFESAVLRLAKRDRNIVRVQPARDVTIVTEGERLIAALPGIGVDTASSILKYCGSAAAALQHLTDEESNGVHAPGIGDGIRRKVRRALDLDPGFFLSVVNYNGKAIERNEEIG